MSRNLYQERLKIRIEDYGPGFDPAREVAGEGNKNLLYIYKETGAEITVRGRGSGYIEPRTGRESSEPLHLFVEHDSCLESFRQACRLAQNLIDTVKDDWLELQRNRGRNSGTDDFYWSKREESEEWFLSKTQNKGDNYRSDKTHKRDLKFSSKDLLDERQETLASRSGERSVWDTRREGISVETDLRQSRDFVDNYHRDKRRELEERWHEPYDGDGRTDPSIDKFDQGATASVAGYSGDSWSNKVWNEDHKWGGRNQTSDRGWNSFAREELNERNKLGFGFEQQQKDDDRFGMQKDESRNQQGERAQKRQWDMSSDRNSSAHKQNNVFSGISEKKKMTEEEFLQLRFGDEFLGEVERAPRQQLNPSVDPAKAFDLTPNSLQNLNHQQLLEVSQLQHSLLMQMSAALTQQPVLPPVSPVQNPFLNVPLQPPPVPPPPTLFTLKSPNQQNMGTSFSQDDGKQNNDRFSQFDDQPSSWRQRPSRWEKEEHLEGDSERKRYSSDVRRRSPEVWRRSPEVRRRSPEVRRCSPEVRRRSPEVRRRSPEVWRRSPEARRGSPRSNIRTISQRTSPERNLIPQRDLSWSSPQIDGQYLRDFPPRRISPTRCEGQERYSPEFENVFSRDNNDKLCRDSTLDKGFHTLPRYKIAVIDKHLNKLTFQDENEIKKIVEKQALAFPTNSDYQVDFAGLDLKDYVFLLLPRSLECMKLLLDLKYLESGHRSYTLFAYEDIYNRYKLKAIIPTNAVGGYCPTAEEVILEVGRTNDLFTNLWKSIKFAKEKKGFFFLVSVDFLSFLMLRKIQWKLRYRTSLIRLEPTKNEKITDERFNRN